MFPLNCVLFPGGLLRLHIFEPRYRALTRDCVAGDGQLGIVLIERGNEVGGGDTRFNVGTRARIIDAAEFTDGRWVLLLKGIERIRVQRWLPDDPYPLADVVTIEEGEPRPDAASLCRDVERSLRKALALKAELGEPAAPATVELDPDPRLAVDQAALAAPLGPADAQRLLETEGPDERLALLLEMLDDEVSVLAHRVSGQ
ncbi:MAG: LON peptidase substrate-binding domain-containing protein [Actinomycetota bacterium]|nr:LON peptidase substrate-binding domain-containing protein [Actinomycetota bacterium]